MEKAGLVKGLEVLNEQHLPVKTLITDRHPHITKYLKDKHPDIDHKYDIWHIAKGELLIMLKILIINEIVLIMTCNLVVSTYKPFTLNRSCFKNSAYSSK